MAEKESIKQNVYNTLKKAILTKQLSPGSQLVEHTISAHLNVSRTPIRSAIQLLADEGLVEMIPNRGAFVINPTREEVVQAYELRKDLEIMAVRDSIGQFTTEDFASMELLISKEKNALKEQNFEAYVEINAAFHIALTKKCNNIFLIEFIETLIQRTSAYLMLFDRFLEETASQPYGYKEHQDIIQLLKEENEKPLIETIQNHFNNAIENLKIQREYTNLENIFKP
ncbi:MAG TPA: GntR family transcriptional regulator [Bacillota bacterium]|nr:GntR family transcriptional regulator [Bacillota bacterium]